MNWLSLDSYYIRGRVLDQSGYDRTGCAAQGNFGRPSQVFPPFPKFPAIANPCIRKTMKNFAASEKTSAQTVPLGYISDAVTEIFVS